MLGLIAGSKVFSRAGVHDLDGQGCQHSNYARDAHAFACQFSVHSMTEVLYRSLKIKFQLPGWVPFRAHHKQKGGKMYDLYWV